MREGESIEIFLTGNLVGTFLKFTEAFGDVENEIDERTVGWAFYLKDYYVVCE